MTLGRGSAAKVVYPWDRLTSVSMVLVLLTLVTSTGMAASAEPAAGRDQVIIGLAQEPDSLNPLFAEMSASLSIMATLYTVDVQRNQRGAAFAQGVAFLPNLKDGTWKLTGNTMSLIWKLRPRNWHDGKAVTCADYVFGHNVARNEQVPVVLRDLTNRIASIVCPQGAGGLDLIVNWRERYPFANLGVTEYGALPRHVLEKFYRQNPSRLNAAPFGNDPGGTVGDGAYRLTEWKRGASITVEAIPTHPILGTPKIRRITWRIIPDTNALVANMLAGSIDAISTIGISFDQAVQLDRQSRGEIKVFFQPGEIWEHIDFNLDNPLLQDSRIRRAMTMGIDRQAIVQQLFDGRQPVAHSYLPPSHPGYSEQGVTKYLYEPDRARQLLEEAGFVPGPDGILRDARGRRMSFELNTTAGNRVREQMEQIIQQDLRKLGIEITIQNFPARVFFGDIINRRKFSALAMYAWVLGPTADCDQLYTSDGIPREGNGWAGQNYPGYSNPDMDRLCRAASREVDETKRNAILADTVRLFARDLPALPLYVRVAVAAAKGGLTNFAPVQIGNTYETWNVHRWFWQ